MQSTDNHSKECSTVKWHLGFDKSSATNGSILDASTCHVFNQSYEIANQKRIQCKVSHCGHCGKTFSESLFNKGSDLLPPCERHCEQCRKTLASDKGPSQLQQNPFTHGNMHHHHQHHHHHPHPTNNHGEQSTSPKVESPCSSSDSSSSSSSSSNEGGDDDDDDDDDVKKYRPLSPTISDLNCSRSSPTSHTTTFQPSHADKTFQCDVCGRAFALVGNMQKHRKLHSGERPFSCDVCGKAFGLRGNLQKHKIIHTGVKLFHCNVCGKPFALRGNMQKHEIIHTGVKPFHCEVCGKRFTLRGNLQKHVLTHSAGAGDKKPFPCDQCGKHFSHDHSLQNHIQSFHGQTANSEHTYRSGFKMESSDLSGPESENEMHPFHHQHH